MSEAHPAMPLIDIPKLNLIMKDTKFPLSLPSIFRPGGVASI